MGPTSLLDQAKTQKLEAKGWKVGTVQEFLGLTDSESAAVEKKLRRARKPRTRQRPTSR